MTNPRHQGATVKVLCPACKTGATVEAPSWTFSDTSVEVPVCEAHSGVISIVVKVSTMANLEVPQSAGVRHRSGFVVFEGGQA